MAETPNLSLDDLFAVRYLVNGDTGAAQREIIRRLQQQLPGAVERENTLRGWSGSLAIPVPEASDIIPAPAEVTDEHIGKYLVECHVSTVNQGSGAFKNTIAVAVHCVDQAVVADQQVYVNWVRGELVRLCLFPFLTGCVNDAEFLCWRQLVPGEMKVLEGNQFTNYSGVTCEMVAVQPPNMN